MISIVICSRKKTIDPKLTENIAQTVGIPHEIIVIDNSNNEYSIFEAYNKGIANSSNEIICLMHDDIRLHTAGWGQIAMRLFEDQPQTGLIGIAGSRIKTRMPSAWWNCPKNLKVMRLIQHYPNNTVKEIDQGFEAGYLSEVAVIDGVFMMLRRNTGVRLNQRLAGFHCYDISLSIECHKAGYRVYVTNQILLEHLSLGTLNKSWYEQTLLMHQLYKNDLPFTIPGYDDPGKMSEYEFDNGRLFLSNLQAAGVSAWRGFGIWLRMLQIKPLSWFHFYCFQVWFIRLKRICFSRGRRL